jgi:DNA polymerase-1
MLHIKNKKHFHIIENLSELPRLQGSQEIFCDVETQRVFDNDKVGGLYPWKGDRICGFGVSADNIKDIWYVPVRHTAPNSNNLPTEPVMNWARDFLTSCKSWINHFVKFDALMFAVGDGVYFDCDLICTCVLAKLLYSDRFGFGLKPLCEDWLDYDTGSLDRIQIYLKSIKSKSYADVPVNLMGEYCCDDVQMNRELYRYLQDKLPAELNMVRNIETKVTPVLFDMEHDGLRIDPTECKIASVKALRAMIETSEKITSLTGRSEFINSNDCIKDILIDQFKLPILATIKEKDEETRQVFDTGRPTFDKDALLLYRVHPKVISDPKLEQIVIAIQEYRKEAQFKSLYLNTFLELHEDGIIHPNYDQMKQTGRLSCRKPSSQQQNQRSKALIHPDEGCGYISNDYSQIEYRLIVHYIKDKKAIKAYNDNPDTDFHQWVAELLLMDRKSGKTLNFGMAYGAGKPKVTAGLMSNDYVIETMTKRVDELIEIGELDPSLRGYKFQELCREHADSSYNAYHKRMPGIKRTARRATDVAAARGYVFNTYGYRRYLPGNGAYKAFNTIIQSSAAYVMKERMVAISPRYNSESKRWEIKLKANVHDELLQQTHVELIRDVKLHAFICETLEETTIKFRVPILTGLGISPDNWAEAAGDETTIKVNGNLITGKLSKLKEEHSNYEIVSGKYK